MDLQGFIAATAIAIELLGVGIIVFGVFACLYHFFANLNHEPFRKIYQEARTGLAQSLLLGLEVLVAADVINSVTGTPNLQSILVLGLIILIRTLLSWSLSIELEGHLPWNKPKSSR